MFMSARKWLPLAAALVLAGCGAAAPGATDGQAPPASRGDGGQAVAESVVTVYKSPT